ncbi:MAG: ferrochelatase [Candidatus Parvarchaeum sp.]
MPEKIGVVVMAYGTPEREEDIEPYLKDIFKGRDVPKPVLQKTIERYRKIGFSPLNQITLKQSMLLQEELSKRGLNAIVAAGMKHWNPRIKDAVETLKRSGIGFLIGIVMHPFSSVMGSKEYEEAFNESSNGMKRIFIDHWYNYEKLYDAWDENIKEAIDSLNDDRFYTIFTSHGLPEDIEDENYKKELSDFSAKLAKKAGIKDFCLAYQNGEHKDWYKPEVNEKLEELKEKGIKNVLIAPIGYISESLETLYDIDVEYSETASNLDINLSRVKCLNYSPLLISAISDAISDNIDKNL